jgi:ABC-2 type transport system permease protein
MNQAWQIARLQLKRTFQSKANLFMMFFLPLGLTFIVGMMVSGQQTEGAGEGRRYPVAVVDQDGSFASETLVHALQAHPNLNVQVVGQADLKKLFADRKIDSGVLIPAGFEQGLTSGTPTDVQLVTAPGGNVYVGVGPVIRRETTRLAQDYRLAVQARGGSVGDSYAQIVEQRSKMSSTVAVRPVTKAVAPAQSGTEMVGQVSVGFTVTFVMMMVFMMSGVILQERQNGTWGRLLTTPTPRHTVLGGYLLSFFLTGMLQFAILVVATRLLFDVAWGPLLPLAAMAAATVLAAGGMGLFLAGMVRSYEQQVTIGVLFINATSMLGGVYWDLSMVSPTMQRIGYLTPQAWAIDGFREVMLRGGAWAGLMWPLVVLLGITAVFLSAGLLRVRYE